MYPPYDFVTVNRFKSAKRLEEFLADRKKILIDNKTGDAIHYDQVHMVDPNIIYDIVGSGLKYDRAKGLSLARDQVWDKVFKRKTVIALREALEAEGEKLIELARVIKDPETGLDVAEWEVIFLTSDGSLIFLETKYRMSKVCY